MIIMVGRAHLGVSQDGHPHDEPDPEGDCGGRPLPGAVPGMTTTGDTNVGSEGGFAPSGKSGCGLLGLFF